jgi:hypothetical protein
VVAYAATHEARRKPTTGTLFSLIAAYKAPVEEMEALQQALREERQKGSRRRPTYEVLEEIRSKAAKH